MVVALVASHWPVSRPGSGACTATRRLLIASRQSHSTSTPSPLHYPLDFYLTLPIYTLPCSTLAHPTLSPSHSTISALFSDISPPSPPSPPSTLSFSRHAPLPSAPLAPPDERRALLTPSAHPSLAPLASYMIGTEPALFPLYSFAGLHAPRSLLSPLTRSARPSLAPLARLTRSACRRLTRSAPFSLLRLGQHRNDAHRKLLPHAHLRF